MLEPQLREQTLTPMLEVRNLTKRFGGLVAVNDVSFEVRHGEILAVIGPNGAGKTTSLCALMGMVKPSSGEIHFDGQRIDGTPPHRIADWLNKTRAWP